MIYEQFSNILITSQLLQSYISKIIINLNFEIQKNNNTNILEKDFYPLISELSSLYSIIYLETKYILYYLISGQLFSQLSFNSINLKIKFTLNKKGQYFKHIYDKYIINMNITIEKIILNLNKIYDICTIHKLIPSSTNAKLKIQLLNIINNPSYNNSLLWLFNIYKKY